MRRLQLITRYKEAIEDCGGKARKGPSPMAFAEKLCDRYAEPHRAYHNLKHLEELLGWLEPIAGGSENYSAISLAVFYHDAIYDPTSHENEEASALLALQDLEALCVPKEKMEKVATYVRATKSHMSIDTQDEDLGLFLDADLSILGSDPKLYDEYAANIRREYGFVPEETYRAGRAAVLARFLEAPTLFRTSYFRGRLEARARANLRREHEGLVASRAD